MAETQYTSTLTGPELDEALRDAAGVDAKVEQAQSAAQQAAQSASSAQGYASAAGSSASAASTAAGTATSKAQDAQTAAEQAADSATQAAQSAASIASSVSAAQSAAEDAESAAQEAQAAQTAAEDAAERAAAAADFDPADFATAAQGAKADTAVQPADLNGYAQTSDIPTELPNPQSLGIRLGSAGSLISYDGSIARMITITPEAIGAQPAGAAAGGGKMTLIRDTGWDSCNIGQTISLPDLSGYDAIGIQVVPDVQKSATDRSQMHIFPIPASGSSECMLCASEIDSGTNFAELVARRLTIYGTTLIISTLGYSLNLPGGPPSAQLCVPRTIYGIKF